VRRALDLLYDAAAWLAAAGMVGVLAMVLASIVTRQLGVNFPGTDAYAGYSMAAAGFLALAHTLKHNEHIRVTLLLQYVKGRTLHGLEMWALSAAVLLSALFAFYSIRLAWNSHAFNDISTSNDATPLWIPQLAMALGAVIFCIAFIDEWWLEFRGLRRTDAPAEALHNE
jgi:TRAP-type C4-dicarboxylate transport system permease small subunit